LTDLEVWFWNDEAENFYEVHPLRSGRGALVVVFTDEGSLVGYGKIERVVIEPVEQGFDVVVVDCLFEGTSFLVPTVAPFFHAALLTT